MGLVRAAVFASIVAIGGAAYVYRDDVIREVGPYVGMGSAAKAAESQASPAAGAQPQGRRGRANPGGNVPVVVTTVGKKPMSVVIEAVGTVQAIASIQIKPRIDSQIMKVNVEEGALVKEGQLLFELDNRTLKAQLGMIEAQIRKTQTQIQQAKRDNERADGLLSKGAGTAVQRDTSATNLKSLEAQLEADEASRDATLTQLSYTEIRAPVSGRIGSINSKAGTVVRVADNTATATLAVINQVDPIFVSFALPQVLLPDLRAAMAKGPVRVDAIVSDKRQSGTMAFIENTVDPNTGTVTAKARINNSNEGLWPGQFVKVEVILGVEPEAIAVTAAAVQLGPQGPYIFVVKDGVAEVRPVVIKRTQSGESVIGSGLAEGESVVVDGQLRLVNGAPVAIRPPPGAPAPASPGPSGNPGSSGPSGPSGNSAPSGTAAPTAPNTAARPRG
ncbi:efflux RND transporter periplasmic adaptor subunit [Reyranella aquatilis]|jgi:multidrug efflux system membrane fusion protein|uniref:Efflux RND transporter periplasmic adaptor subunit n=1 Tax=Reyranella aquatilis TaxID=2035356 RepID=A0ABS8L2Q9_9HYPH|nr:efflux RND transporter periplasmic adaptor subunit [Reyranella aquatilis]MCC8432619.1 efflux RND transporter periplasmic adaptor subunit [Reyranella aquatilis]